MFNCWHTTPWNAKVLEKTTIAQWQAIMAMVSANVQSREIVKLLNIKKILRNTMPWKSDEMWSSSSNHQEDLLVIQMPKENHLRTAVYVKSQTNLNVEVQTIKMRLREAGLQNRNFIIIWLMPTKTTDYTSLCTLKRHHFDSVVFYDEQTLVSDEHRKLHY